MSRRSSRKNANNRNNTNNNTNEGNIDPAILAALNQAVATAVAQIVPQAVATALQTNVNNNGGTDNNNPNGNAGGGGHGNQGTPTYVLLERFQKQKPDSFHAAATPLDAENWVAHLEKIFEVLECTENQKVRLATYKLEGDAQRWWKALKTAEGEGYLDALTWRDFLNVFYEHYFPVADRDAYRREYISIRQKPNETITSYMERFIRVANIAGAMAGSAEEQAEKFKWGLVYEHRRPIINTKFAKVSEVANAAKNLELERADFVSYKGEYNNYKRGRDDHHGQNSDRPVKFQSSQQRDRFQSGQPRQWQGQRSYHNMGNSHGEEVQNQRTRSDSAEGDDPNRIPITPCPKCGANHPGKPCYRETGACFTCGKMGHRAKDCNSQRNTDRRDGSNNQRNTGGRVFSMTTHQAPTSSGTVFGTPTIFDTKA